MTIKVINEQQNLQEVIQVLLTHLEPSKVMKFWAACKLGEGDYLWTLDKKDLFADNTREQEMINLVYSFPPL